MPLFVVFDSDLTSPFICRGSSCVHWLDVLVLNGERLVGATQQNSSDEAGHSSALDLCRLHHLKCVGLSLCHVGHQQSCGLYNNGLWAWYGK